MRFAQLTLERYGRFENCTLDFRSGAPDLHLVYGANETGKSTTLAAVSDLLFGFPARSPFNFRFDYPLLRIGAVLEDEGRRFACRRRKAQSQTLVDGLDRPIDEGPLLSMLRGQDRERFRLSFSLDQTRLREGGRAMVEAKDDLGQALFAAGSGMTGVVAALDDLKEESETIWGPRAKAGRLYTAAERQHEEAQRRVREGQLKPKTWTDARDALRRCSDTLEGLETERAELAGERRVVERMRRIGPDVRRRAELLAALAESPAAVRLTAQSEAAAEAALTALQTADRAAATETLLLEELDARDAALASDRGIIEATADIEALLKREGADQKGAADLARLRAEISGERAREAALRAELGGAVPSVPRPVVFRLRELAGQYGKADAASKELRQSITDAAARAEPLRLAVADAEVAEGVPELAAAVHAARDLGADIDARCAAQALAAERLDAQTRTAVERLAPWSGSPERLAALPPVAAEEIDAAQAAASHAATDEAAEQAEIERADERLEEVGLKRRLLTEGGQAVPSERIQATRGDRERNWTHLRATLLGGAPPADPLAEVQRFEAAVQSADEAADQRFALAEASGRIALLDLQAAELSLARAQAASRRARAETGGVASASAWADRLVAAGLPALAPARLRAWLEARRDALEMHSAAQGARDALGSDLARRAQAHARLAGLVPAAPDDAQLAALLERAERLLAEGEGRNRQFGKDKAELRLLEDQVADLSRRAARTDAQRADLLTDWERERTAYGLDLPIDAAEGWLESLDKLREIGEAADRLSARVSGIERDAAAFAADVDDLADRLGQPTAPNPGERLDGLRARLSAGRSVADARRENQASRQTRQDALRAAIAARDAAMSDLRPRMAELGVEDVQRMPAALEASREARLTREALNQAERRIEEAGDGHAVAALVEAFAARDPDALPGRLELLDQKLAALDARITDAADATGSARRTFEALETGPGAADAASDAALARAEMDAQAESYILKRAQALTLRWAVERYRSRRQNPLLARASELFRTLTLGRYLRLEIDPDTSPPRLLGVCEDGSSLVEVDHMSEGTADQLFLALRLAGVEQAIAAGSRLPFLADDLFVNFDDARALAGLKVLTELARSTQVLVFTHHAHLAEIARTATGADVLSECTLS